MVKDLFERIQQNKGPLGKMGFTSRRILCVSKLEELGPRMKFHGKEILNWSINDYLGLANHPEVRKIDAQSCHSIWCKHPIEPMNDEWTYYFT